MQDKGKIIINDYINNDPLSEETLDKTLEFINKFRLSLPNKNIWLYTGYEITDLIGRFILSPNANTTPTLDSKVLIQNIQNDIKRSDIVSMCDIVIDGRYIESQRNPSLKWRGSSNQKVIDVQKSLKQNKIVLYCE